MFDSDRENATIKLIDFGFCKIFEGEADMFAVLGSPYYVAPEVLHVSAAHLRITSLPQGNCFARQQSVHASLCRRR